MIYVIDSPEHPLPVAEAAEGLRSRVTSVPVADWGDALTPWSAPALRPGEKDFGGRADKTLASLAELLDRAMGALSGGQLQRVLLALALEPVPHILILDEPLSGVDIEGEHQLLEMLDELRTQYDLSILLSTHDFATLGQFADKVILLNRRVLREGPPDEVLSSPEFYDTFHLRMGRGGER